MPNHAFEPFSLGEKCSGRDLAPLEIEANMKNFLRLSHLILSMIVIFPLSIPSRIILIVLDLDNFFMKIRVDRWPIWLTELGELSSTKI